MRTEALAAGNAIGVAKARAAADGAVERTAFELTRPKLPGSWLPNGAPHEWRDGEIAIVARATDETAKIDLNAAGEVLLRGLFTSVGGADPDVAVRLVEAVMDWRDADDLRRPKARRPPTTRDGIEGRAANAPFETIGEVARVLGMTPAIYSRIAGSVTVYSRQAGVPLTASRECSSRSRTRTVGRRRYVASREALRAGTPPRRMPARAG
jgi:general secretion pathway protein K